MMKTRPLRPALLALTVLTAMPLMANTPAASPEPRTLVERHIQALGGMENIQKSQTGTLTGTFSIPAAGIHAPMTVAFSGHEKIISKVELPGVGAIQSGIIGEAVWMMDPFQGPRLLENSERAQQLESYHPDAIRRLPSFVNAMNSAGTAEYNGKRCHKVNIQWKSGRESWDCYGVDDGLLLASGGKTSSPMGEIEVTTVIKQYGELAGQKMPVHSEMQMMGQTQVLKFTGFDSTPPGDEVFALPPAIQGLLGSSGNTPSATGSKASTEGAAKKQR
ncbi:MAG: hypothetical protein Q4B94_09700 [Pseudomonadota bacterium]|nr:hypothetical protein [Pseudomonadota bacterium]